LSIRWIEIQLNNFLNKTLGTVDQDYIVASDTDSIYLTLDKLVNKVLPNETDDGKIAKFLDKASNDIIQPFIDKKFDELSVAMNCRTNAMHMKREAIASKGIWKAKKMYILNILIGEEGVLLDTPDLKIMGIETAKSSTPKVVREALTETIRIILSGDQEDVLNYIDTFREKFRKMNPRDVGFPRGCNGLEEYSDSSNIYKPKTPIHVRAALLYNHRIKAMKLDKKFPYINSGDKIKFIYLKKRNPIGENVIAYFNNFPEDFGLRQYIDWDVQFEKTYLEPIKAVLDIVGWKCERTVSFESLFE